MNNIIFKSIFYIVLSFAALFVVIFLYNNNYTINFLFFLFRYTIHELIGLVIFLSQFLYVLLNKNRNNSAIIVYTFVCSIIYYLFDLNLTENDFTYITKVDNSDIQIYREISSSINSQVLWIINIVKEILKDIHRWDPTDYVIISSFSIFLLNISILTRLDRANRYNIIGKVVAIFFLIMFNLYLWNYSLNIIYILFSIILLKNGRYNREIN